MLYNCNLFAFFNSMLLEVTFIYLEVVLDDCDNSEYRNNFALERKKIH